MTQVELASPETHETQPEPIHQPYPASDTPPSIHEEMLASIARTGLLSDRIFMPAISSEALQAGNRVVEAEYGSDARRLLIVGPDTIALEDHDSVIQLPTKPGTELLGYALWLRRLTKLSDYLGVGLFDGAVSQRAQELSSARARDTLRKLAASHRFDPLVKQRGERGQSVFGVDDIIVKDLRRSRAYAEARQKHSQGLFERFILEGEHRPRMTEPPMIHAARVVLRKVTGLIDEDDGKQRIPLDTEQQERFRIISQQQSRLVDSRTDIYDIVHPLRYQQEAISLREEIRETFEPDWQQRAACRGPQSRFFHPPANYEYKADKLDRHRQAKAICASCPVIQDCLLFALQNKEKRGIWGGATEDERQAMLIRDRA